MGNVHREVVLCSYTLQDSVPKYTLKTENKKNRFVCDKYRAHTLLGIGTEVILITQNYLNHTSTQKAGLTIGIYM